MICSINTSYRTSGMCAVIDYHEAKVEKGVAQRDETNLAAHEANDIKDLFALHVDTFNPRVYSNQFHQVSFNFAPTDQLSTDQKRAVIQEWMDKMGYANHLYVLYHHTDKAHDHWHLITPCSDINGLRLQTRDNFHKSARITRTLEQKYGLRVLSVEGEKRSEKHKNLNTESFNLHNAFLKVSDEHALNPSYDLLRNLLEQGAFTYEQASYAYRKAGRMSDLRGIVKELTDRGVLSQPARQRLFKLILDTRNEAHSKKEFYELLTEQGIYNRVVNKRGVATHVFSLDEKYYFNDKEISRDLTVDNINAYFANPAAYQRTSSEKSDKEIKAFLTKSLKRGAYYAGTLAEFDAFLKAKAIEIRYHSNSGGIYGYSVSFDGRTYKASSLDKNLSYSKLANIIEANHRSKRPRIISLPAIKRQLSQSAGSTIQKISRKIGSGMQQAADEAEYERKKKYDQESNQDFDMGF